MTDLATLDAYGVVTEPMTMRIQRLLPGPIERVWAYLVEGDLRRRWLAAGDISGAGTTVELVWRNDELTDPPGNRPEGFAVENRMETRILAFDPPRLLTLTWNGTGNVTFELEPKGGEVLLTLTHRDFSSRDQMLKHSAGWHAHLDILAADATGRAKAPFWDSWLKLVGEYDARI